MSVHRYLTFYAPVEHINGKIAPSAVKVKNVQNEPTEPAEGFPYGYRKANQGYISRFAVRSKPRVLSQKPYTRREYDLQYYFRRGVYHYTRYRDTQPNNRWTALQNAFASQSQYTTAYTLCIAKVIQNRGAWPDEWN